MRKLTCLVAGVVLCLASQAAHAQNTSSTFSPVSSAINYQFPFAAPSLATAQLTPSISILNWFGSLNPLFRNTAPLGSSGTYPADNQLPGMSYLQTFGYRVAQPAQ
jgi:hypothetical protein